MRIWDMSHLVISAVAGIYNIATKRPRVTCDVRGVYGAKWGPDYLPDESGKTVAEGIEIYTGVEILLANNGPVDTTLQDAYVVVKSHKKVLGHLRHYLLRGKHKHDESYIHGIVIEPRRIWGPEHLHFRGSMWGIEEPQKDWEAELVIEVVAQRPVKRKISLYF